MRAKYTKIFMSCFILFFVFSSVSYALNPVDPYFEADHYTTLLMDQAPVYDSANFHYISFFTGYSRAYQSGDENSSGEMTIEGGSYSYWNENNVRQNVDGENRTFPLRYTGDGEPFYSLLLPNGNEITFRRAADGGLQGKTIRWHIDNDPENVNRVPNFRTTQRQLETYVPFIELHESGGIYRMVSPNNTAQTVSVPHLGRYRVELFDSNGNRVRVVNDEDLPADTPHSGLFTYPAGIRRQDITQIEVRARLDEEDIGRRTHRYRWNFYIAEKSNVGLQLTPMALNVNEVKEFTFTINPGYVLTDRNWIHPMIWNNDSVFSPEDWNVSDNVLTLTLKGIKQGSNSLSIAYTRDGVIYYTEPVTVTVTGGTTPPPSNGSSGGGCNTGYGVIGLLLAAFATFKYLRKR